MLLLVVGLGVKELVVCTDEEIQSHPPTTKGSAAPALTSAVPLQMPAELTLLERDRHLWHLSYWQIVSETAPRRCHKATGAAPIQNTVVQ
jgi:hypothetical protein